MLKVSAITIEKIEKNKLEKFVPELYELKDVLENNDWHTNDSTFNHTLKVMKQLRNIETENKKLGKCLSKKITSHTRKELLFVATMFHDIAKKDTIVKKGDETYFLGHEKSGSPKALKILGRFDLSVKEKKFVTAIIKNHGVLHILLSERKNLDERLLEVKKKYSYLFLELVLITLADTMGCELKNKNPEDFRFRVNFYKNILGSY